MLTILNKIGHGRSCHAIMAIVQEGNGVDCGKVAASVYVSIQSKAFNEMKK